jgi:hypothetical protein
MISATVNPYSEDFALPHRRRGEGIFPLVFLFCVAVFVSAGLYLKTVKPLPQVFDQKKMEIMRTRFMLSEKKAPAKKTGVLAEAVKKIEHKKALDLTKPVVLGAKENDIVKNPADADAAVRRVYGLRRVYSVGLGAGGSASDAVVGKLGNTLNKDIDTLKATEKDLKGQLVSVTTITSMPELESMPKLEYTDDMKKHGVTGTISVKLLIDIDGMVKEAAALNDLGYGTKEAVLAAAKKMKFKPAMQGTSPAALWIIYKIKFVLQE